MNTLAKLQAHLNQPTIQYRPGLNHKPIANLVTCADGFTLSVQASEHHYCDPRTNNGPYNKVEVWRCGAPSQFSEYGDGEDPYGYVPIDLVCQVIDEHGGFAP